MSNEADISPDLTAPKWRASSYSGGQGNCVEVADHHLDLVCVRDSKCPAGPIASFSRAAWEAFVAHLA
ncbi:DUF397 domain-containing protein [Streptomyces sparsogenes]|uniref:DUF397 domain-containing protein n=1 Tax=Streptomyces sparsogenes TaxID=67365 RepID=UPI00384BBBE4